MIVFLVKKEETDAMAIYLYGPDEKHMGEFTLNKHTGEVRETLKSPVENHRRLFIAGASKIRIALRTGLPLPARELYASG